MMRIIWVLTAMLLSGCSFARIEYVTLTYEVGAESGRLELASKERIRETVVALFSKVDGAFIDGVIDVSGPERYRVTLTGRAEGLDAEASAAALADAVAVLRALSTTWGVLGPTFSLGKEKVGKEKP